MLVPFEIWSAAWDRTSATTRLFGRKPLIADGAQQNVANATTKCGLAPAGVAASALPETTPQRARSREGHVSQQQNQVSVQGCVRRHAHSLGPVGSQVIVPGGLRPPAPTTRRRFSSERQPQHVGSPTADQLQGLMV